MQYKWSNRTDPVAQGMNRPIRHGDVLLIPTVKAGSGTRLSHLVLAEGEVSGHRHHISEGQAELVQSGQTLYLRVLSKTALLVHEEHRAVAVPQGDWLIRIQREYEPGGWHGVAD